MFLTAVIAALVGILLCALIVGHLARRLRLPLREIMVWWGLVEYDVSPLARSVARRRS